MADPRTAFWAVYALSYDLAWDSPFTSHVAYAVRRHIPRNSVVVDLGTGTGLLSQQLHEHGCLVVGVDASAAMLKRAKLRGRIARGVLADASDTRLPTGLADAVLCGNVLHLHPDPARVVDEAVRLAKPGALLAWTTPAPGITGSRVWAADRRHGRSRAVAALGYSVRANIVGLAAFSGVRVTPHTRVAEVLADGHRRHALTVRDSFDVDGVQRVTVSEAPQVPAQNS